MELNDADLIAAVLKGDAASFEPLIQKYSPRVFATARRYARRESEVEDIVQEVCGLYKQSQAKLVWVRGHVGDPGNELADHWANKAREGATI